MSDQEQPYTDYDGNPTPVDPESFSSFTDYVEMCGIDGFDEIDGISCATVHPKLHELQREIEKIIEEHGGKGSARDFMTRLMQQIQVCLLSDLVAGLQEDMPPALQEQDIIALPTALFVEMVGGQLGLAILSYHTLAPQFDDNEALLAAEKMQAYIEALHEAHDWEMPDWWGEIVKAMKGYEPYDAE